MCHENSADTEIHSKPHLVGLAKVTKSKRDTLRPEYQISEINHIIWQHHSQYGKGHIMYERS